MHYTSSHAKKALDIVKKHLPKVTNHPEYQNLVSILRDESRWEEAHDLFGDIRSNITLSMIDGERSLDHYFVYIAENAAKTAYNCSGGSAPFDSDSFEWLLRCERNFVKQVKPPSGRPRNLI